MVEHQEWRVEMNAKRTGVQDRVAFAGSETLPFLVLRRWLDPEPRPPEVPHAIHPYTRDISCLCYRDEL